MQLPLPRVGRLLLVFSLLLPAAAAPARDDPRAYDASVFLLSESMRPHRDGRHNQLLLALRHLRDPALAPLFEALAASPHPAQRIHGHLGLAEVSPAGHLDLAAAAEIEDPRELTELLGAAIDEGLVPTADLSQVLRWRALDAAARQALAVRVVAGGGIVDENDLRDSLIMDDEDVPGVATLMRHGLAALLLAERGDPGSRAELDKLRVMGRPEDRDAVRAQVLEATLHHGFRSAGPWALSIAQDDATDPRLRLVALRVALRYTDGDGRAEARSAWQREFDAAEETAQRIRLALIALDAAPWAQPALFDALTNEQDALLSRIGEAGRAISNRDADASQAVVALVEQGHPVSMRWALSYAREHAVGDARTAILLSIVTALDTGHERTRARRTASAIDAAQALAEADPAAAERALVPLLSSNAPARRGELTLPQAVLLGLVRARGTDLADLAAALPDQADNDARDLTLLLRARWDAPMGAAGWSRLSEIAAGASTLDLSLRVQACWAYLKHLRRAGEAIREATSP